MRDLAEKDGLERGLKYSVPYTSSNLLNDGYARESNPETEGIYTSSIVDELVLTAKSKTEFDEQNLFVHKSDGYVDTSSYKSNKTYRLKTHELRGQTRIYLLLEYVIQKKLG